MAKKDLERGLVTRGDLLKGAAALGLTALLGGSALEEALAMQQPVIPRKRPNLLFVFSDQQSWDMLGCAGNEQIQTPNLDRFASQGVHFNHCVSASCVCTPFRGMLFSGQHCLNNGAWFNDIEMLPSQHGEYLAEVIRDAGYKMGYVGKWHLLGGDRYRPIPAGPLRYGFDGLFLSNNCTVDFRPGYAYYWNEAGEKVLFDEWEVYGQTRQALNFLDECDGEEPFCLFVSWHPPHDNVEGYGAPQELLDLYDPATLKLRPNAEDTPKRRSNYQGHMAMCTGVDQAFGWLMDKLEEKGLADNTVVIFTSDHGDTLGSCGRPWPKGFPEDESVRVPLIARWPGHLQADRKSELLVGTLDLMPTLLGLMDLPIPATCQGTDLSGAILGGHDDAVNSVPLFMPYMMQGWRGVYTHRFTYTFDEGIDQPIRFATLFDRKQDPHQQHNLFGDVEHASLQARLHTESLKWMERFEDRFVPGAELINACFGEAGLPKAGPPHRGTLPGRPLDLIRNLPGLVDFG